MLRKTNGLRTGAELNAYEQIKKLPKQHKDNKYILKYTVHSRIAHLP